MGLPFTAGQRITAADLNTATQQGAWTSYTPSWTSSGSAPAIGNGSIVGYYSKIGRTVTVRAGIYCGSTTTFGTGFYGLVLPFTAQVTNVPSGQFAIAGSWVLANAGSTFYNVNAMITQDTPTAVRGIVNGSGSFFGAANPAAWSASSATQFAVTITYESTS